MENQDFSKIGQEIKDAVNKAVDSGDFSSLNDAISHTVDQAVKGMGNIAADAVRGAQGKINDAMRDAQSRVNESMDRAAKFVGGDRRKTYENKYGRYDKSQLKKEFSEAKKAGQQIFGGEGQRAYRLNEDIYRRYPVSVSAILMTVFGSIFLFGFGIPSLVSLALGIGFRSFGIFQSLGVFAFLPLTLAGFGMLVWGVNQVQRRNRFYRYVKSIGTKTICAVKTLSRAVGKPEGYVCRDLEEMIESGLFLQGHMDDEKTCLMLTDETYKMYQQSKERVRAAKEEEEQRKKEQKKQKEVKEKLQQASTVQQEIRKEGLHYMEVIRQVNEELPEPVISEKLDKLERVIGLIYIRLQKNPDQLSSMKRFTDYYLPTTIKLVNAYREFEQSQMETERIQASKKEIEQTLDTINLAFERMLDSLYEEDTMDISADIQVLQTLLAQEGLTDDGLHSMDDLFEGVSGVRKA